MKQISDTNLFILTTSLALMSAWTMTQFFSFSGINSLILTHVTLGGLAFIVGGITLFSKKGSPLHKLTGKIFYFSMVVSVSMTLVVSLLPNHVSPTLFHIGVLSLYFLFGGKRSITFKKPNHNLFIDRLLAYTVVFLSIAIMSYSIIKEGNFHPLRTVFGTIGICFGLLDFWLFRQPQNLKRRWLILHLSKMLGGYTAAVTAFFVAQNILSGYFNWFVPTAIGLIYIFFWMLKLKIIKPMFKTKMEMEIKKS